MGYRSDVTSAIYGTDGMIDALIARHTFETGRSIHEHFGAEELTRFERTVTRYGPRPDYAVTEVRMTFLRLSGSGWKWYDGYDDVEAWKRLLYIAEQMAEEGFDICYEFVRIGEEDGDVEQASGGDEVCHYIRIRTEISDTIHKETGP